MSEQQKNIDIWVQSQKMSIKFMLKGIVVHFRDSDQFRIGLLFASLYIGSIFLLRYWGLAALVRTDAFQIWIISILGAFPLAACWLLVFALVADTVMKVVKFFKTMNEKGVREHYASLTKLTEEKEKK